MNDCYFDKKDWRTCRKEVSFCCSSSLSSKDSNHLANETIEEKLADPVCIHIDGNLQRMLEEAGERSEDRDEGRSGLTSQLPASI